ncbi:hypothetical protein BH09ACT5_BH09ACT5_04690 [soil metagenome]
MTAARLKLTLILAGVVTAGLVLLAWTQAWFVLVLVDGTELSVSGQAAAPALSALGLASLALVAALAIAGPRVRIVLGVVELAIGAFTVVVAANTLAHPLLASASTVTGATAVSGPDSIAAVVSQLTTSAWPGAAVAAGALTALVGIAVLATGRRWPGPTKKYETRGDDNTGTPVGAWDSLSDGSDPTR